MSSKAGASARGLEVGTGASAGVSAAISLFSPVGLGVGGIFVPLDLVALPAHYNTFEAAILERTEVNRTLVSTIVPLAFTFGGIVLFQPHAGP